jgi:hypothetical protein
VASRNYGYKSNDGLLLTFAYIRLMVGMDYRLKNSHSS